VVYLSTDQFAGLLVSVFGDFEIFPDSMAKANHKIPQSIMKRKEIADFGIW